jgi:hypothetical protein
MRKTIIKYTIIPVEINNNKDGIGLKLVLASITKSTAAIMAEANNSTITGLYGNRTNEISSIENNLTPL